jgi:hypothetical protein
VGVISLGYMWLLSSQVMWQRYTMFNGRPASMLAVCQNIYQIYVHQSLEWADPTLDCTPSHITVLCSRQ